MKVQAIARCASLALALGVAFAATPASAINLQASIDAPPNGAVLNQQNSNVSIQGSQYNADPQGAFVAGGLRAFYFIGDLAVPRPVPDDPAPASPAAGPGRNSEFAANAQNSANWWVNNGGEFLPPYQSERKTNNGGVGGGGINEDFAVRMEGRINIPANGNYNFAGGADDHIRVWVDGQPVFNNRNAARLNGNVQLTAGQHGFTAVFVENGGGQNYNFNLPGGTSLEANAVDEHTYAGATLEVGHNFQENRVGFLTARVNNGQNGAGAQVGPKFHFAGPATADLGNGGVRQGDPVDSFRLTLTGYWNAAGGSYVFTSNNADDSVAFGFSSNPNDDPNTVPIIADDDGDGVTPGIPQTTGPIVLAPGLYPVRFEFGEGGGGANFNFQFNRNGTGNQMFAAADLQTTDELVFDYELLKTFNTQMNFSQELLNWNVPTELQGQMLTLRLRTYGTDQTFDESLIQFQLNVVPEPSTMLLLGLGVVGLVGYNRRRRRAAA